MIFMLYLILHLKTINIPSNNLPNIPPQDPPTYPPTYPLISSEIPSKLVNIPYKIRISIRDLLEEFSNEKSRLIRNR